MNKDRCIMHKCARCNDPLLIAHATDDSCICGDWVWINDHSIRFIPVKGRLLRNVDLGGWVMKSATQTGNRNVKNRRPL